jgi:hypothetical protein
MRRSVVSYGKIRQGSSRVSFVSFYLQNRDLRASIRSSAKTSKKSLNGLISQSSRPMTPAEKVSKIMKQKTIVILLVIVAVLYLGGRYVYYGSFTRNCIYTEESFPVPEQLKTGTIVIAKAAYQGAGMDKEHGCLENFSGIDREIIAPESINNITIGKEYYTEKGIAVEPLNIGTAFRVVGMISVTKHGISTIDSGPGPIHYLILEDQGGRRYQIATVMLGINKTDLFLSYRDSGSSADMPLTPYHFDPDTGKYISTPAL